MSITLKNHLVGRPMSGILRRFVAFLGVIVWIFGACGAARGVERTPRELLFDAVLWGNECALDRALAHGATLETRNENGDTPLLWVVKSGESESLRKTEELLLKRGANIRARDRNGVSVWHAANQEAVPLLVRYGADVNERDAQGQTRLMREVYPTENSLVRLLLDHGADPNLPDKKGQTALMLTTDSSFIPLLLSHGANINARDKQGETVLMRWIWDGNGWGTHSARDVAVLLRRGADVHLAHPQGSAVERAARYLNLDTARTMLQVCALTAREKALLQRALLSDALFGAATDGRPENLRKWLRRGADPNIVINDLQFELNGLTPLMIAAQRPPSLRDEKVSPSVVRREAARDVEVARLLLARGADPDYQVQSPTMGLRGQSALGYAIDAGKPELVELLLRRGAKLSSSGGRATALFGAINDPTVMRILLDYGANPNARTSHGRTPLMYAAGSGSPDVVQMLLSRGADPNSGDLKGAGATPDYIATPLISAVRRYRPDEQSVASAEQESAQIARMLLHGGARINERDHFGQSALSQAAAYDQVSMAQLLLQAGAAIELPNKLGQTPLMAACAGRFAGYRSAAGGFLLPPNPDAVSALLQHGANPNARDKEGNTPSILAVRYDWRSHLGRGGPDEYKHIPLYFLQNAARAKRCLNLLLQHGANPRLRDKGGRTALDWAKSQGNRDMTRLLERATKPAKKRGQIKS